jgi:hypothetical protein
VAKLTFEKFKSHLENGTLKLGSVAVKDFTTLRRLYNAKVANPNDGKPKMTQNSVAKAIGVQVQLIGLKEREMEMYVQEGFKSDSIFRNFHQGMLKHYYQHFCQLLEAETTEM